MITSVITPKIVIIDTDSLVYNYSSRVGILTEGSVAVEDLIEACVSAAIINIPIKDYYQETHLDFYLNAPMYITTNIDQLLEELYPLVLNILSNVGLMELFSKSKLAYSTYWTYPSLVFEYNIVG